MKLIIIRINISSNKIKALFRTEYDKILYCKFTKRGLALRGNKSGSCRCWKINKAYSVFSSSRLSFAFVRLDLFCFSLSSSNHLFDKSSTSLMSHMFNFVACAGNSFQMFTLVKFLEKIWFRCRLGTPLIHPAFLWFLKTKKFFFFFFPSFGPL